MQYLNGKRYFTMSQYCSRKFGSRIAKIPLSSGMTCPNRDGAKGTGGCSFCSGAGGGEFSPCTGLSLEDQYNAGLPLINKWKSAKPVAYFQSFSNTYAPVEQVRKLLSESLSLEGLAGIRIATRADCIDKKIAELLDEFSEKTVVEIELGLQTVFDSTAKGINRCHSFEEFCEGFSLLKDKNLYTCVHLINGLPQETPEMMLESAKTLAMLRPNGIKLHMLHILEGTQLAQEYQINKFPMLSQKEYVSIVCDQLRYFAPDTVIERLTGDGARRSLIAPLWTLNKRSVLNDIDGELARRDIWQGDLWEDKL